MTHLAKCYRAIISAAGLGVLLCLGACTQLHPTGPAYTVGAPYRTGDIWQYPREDFALTQTGLASTLPSGARARLTAVVELADAATPRRRPPHQSRQRLPGGGPRE